MDYFKEDEEFSWVAAHCFTDVHHGRALSETELKLREQILEAYKDEIAQTKEIIKSTPGFEQLDYCDQINFAANMLVKLKEEKEAEVSKKI